MGVVQRNTNERDIRVIGSTNLMRVKARLCLRGRPVRPPKGFTISIIYMPSYDVMIFGLEDQTRQNQISLDLDLSLHRQP